MSVREQKNLISEILVLYFVTSFFTENGYICSLTLFFHVVCREDGEWRGVCYTKSVTLRYYAGRSV